MSVFKVTIGTIADNVSNNYVADTISFAGLTGNPAWGYFPDGRAWFAFAGTPPDQLVNADTYSATNLILSGFNDTLMLQGDSPVRAVNGGPGEDKISSSPDGPGITIEGGNNNDVLSGLSPERDHLIGQNDNDTLIMDGMDEATGGAGADRFLLTQLTGGSAFITDLQAAPGKNHDTIDLWQPLHNAGYDFNSFTDAKNAGALGVTYAHGYTYLSFDTNGDGIPDHEFAHIKGVVTPELFDTTFTVTYAQSYAKTMLAGDDVLDGTLDPTQQKLYGREGNDILILDGADRGTGGPGADRFVLTSAKLGDNYFLIDVNPDEHDVVDFWKALNVNGYAFDSFSDAQTAGVLGITYQYGYTFITYDLDGDHHPEYEFAHIKGVILPSEIDQTFLTSYEDSYFHQAGLA